MLTHVASVPRMAMLACCVALASCSAGNLAGPSRADGAGDAPAPADAPVPVADAAPADAAPVADAAPADAAPVADAAPADAAAPADGAARDAPAGDAAADFGGPAQLVLSQALQLDQTALAIGQAVRGTVSYQNVGGAAITIPALVIAVEGPGGSPHVNAQPVLTNLTFAAGQTHTLTAAHALAPGSPTGGWTAFSSWQDSAGAWHEAAPVAFSVSAGPAADAGPAPDGSAPDVSPAPDGPAPDACPSCGAILPVVAFARPGGGQWTLRFSDEFDGTGGTAAEAMSGANFVDKTVGGGALPGNPGLNPRKWNMGWWTGPATVNGLGEVTTATAWGPSQTQWWGVESLVFPGDATLRLRSQRASWNGYHNQMGMISTAGLLACNPAHAAHGSVPADRFVDGPQILEWKAAGTFIVDWPAMWMTNGGNFGGAGSQWPGGSQYSEEIDLVEPIFRLHAASEFQKGKPVVPAGWDGNALLTWTWFFDAARIILWVTNESGQTVKMFDIPDAEVPAAAISAQWVYPQYLMFAQQSKVADTADGDMALHYVRIWN